MRITGWGNASVAVEAGGRTLFFDPYHKDSVPVAETAQTRDRRRQALERAETVFITHGHFDHLGSVTGLYRDRTTEVWCTQRPARTLEGQGFPPERLRRVTPGAVLDLGGVEVRAYHTAHCVFNAGEVGRVLFHNGGLAHPLRALKLLGVHAAYPSGGECLLYEIAGDGLRLQLLGSAGLDRGEAYPTGADGLILPYQGRSDMARYCLGIVERLRPKAVLLDHFDNAFPPLTCQEDPTPFISQMARAHPEIACRALGEGERVTLPWTD